MPQATWIQKRDKRESLRVARLALLEKRIRRLRQRIFIYYDQSQETGEKASRILSLALAIAAPLRSPPPVDQWGATADDRRNLARNGMAWGD